MCRWPLRAALCAYLHALAAEARADYRAAVVAWAAREPHYDRLPAPEPPALLALAD